MSSFSPSSLCTLLLKLAAHWSQWRLLPHGAGAAPRPVVEVPGKGKVAAASPRPTVLPSIYLSFFFFFLLLPSFFCASWMWGLYRGGVQRWGDAECRAVLMEPSAVAASSLHGLQARLPSRPFHSSKMEFSPRECFLCLVSENTLMARMCGEPSQSGIIRLSQVWGPFAPLPPIVSLRERTLWILPSREVTEDWGLHQQLRGRGTVCSGVGVELL